MNRGGNGNSKAPDLCVMKKSSSLGDLIIKPIEKPTAKAIIVKNHYSHTWNDGGFGIFNFGIFRAEAPDDCLGCVVYGFMKNPKARLFTHPRHGAWMCELNRMWISDDLGKNAETILISHSIRLIRRIDRSVVAIQSFADGRLGCGTIYKAANFRYYGYTWTRFFRDKNTGRIYHNQILTNTTSPTGYVRSNVLLLLGDLVPFRVKTYRYIYPLDKRYRCLLKEQPYPEYERGEFPADYTPDREIIVRRVIERLRPFAK